ncbi:ABC transporter permease [Deinococcus metallilatus]|uniref:ABC transporter permease n=1 Tax=Deinococcus metallilatus TaxID=1211322 RepID=A0AAJ5F612_9DEIO|nr:ABC transporter permease [Deinococcus metallilatus]MBB5294801.1 simple sugar transport system permease protein [Deinococcus metallilatus]QBY09478.1 ABC transporter permease [Deinococcus metallilatus]RXJ09483.1 ABC transporter permease [Deinococcus metallilatus]TLK29005.1 ABC transporter permease [Deinococcus metallilatus]GMA16727.1 ABC transporter permease [Deinococcus metallilatus]
MEGLFAQLLTTAFLATFIRSVVPLLLTALGGLFSERSGVVNIALDGLIIFGALAGAIVTYTLDPTLGALAPWVGWLAGALVGGLIAWIHAVVSIKYRADQVISGTAINLLATGVPSVILQALYGTSTESPKVAHPLPLWGVGELRFSPPVYFAFLAVAVTWYVLYRTPYGLRLRATGEHPGAAASMGVNVRRMRYSGVILSGLLAGTAGVFLSVGNLDAFVRNISAGLGFIALAALIFGQWKPLGVLGATVLFGFLQAISITLGGTDLLPPTLVAALPYLITIIALIFTGRSAAPRALGKPFEG